MLSLSSKLFWMLPLFLSLLGACGSDATPIPGAGTATRETTTVPVVATATMRAKATTILATATPDPTRIPTETGATAAAAATKATGGATVPFSEEETILSTQLISAAAVGNTKRVQELLAQGAPLNGQDERGRTAVMAATHGNHVETVRVLLDAGADVNLRDARLDNPFLYAGAEGMLEILKLAYAAGADPTITNRFGGTALIPACERGHVEVVRYLLDETTVNVNHVNNLGWTGLLEAIILSDGGPHHQEIVGLLIAHGADVNLADKDGVTPLAHARRQRFREIERMLVEAGARE